MECSVLDRSSVRRLPSVRSLGLCWSAICLLVSLLPYTAAQGILYLNEDAPCEPDGGSVCRLLSDCTNSLLPAGSISVRSGARVCSYRGTEPLICCPTNTVGPQDRRVDPPPSGPIGVAEDELTTTINPQAPPQIIEQGAGEVCQGGGGQETWYCRHHTDCPGIREEIQKGLNPKICSFFKREPVICCPPWAAGATTTTTPRTTTRAPWSPGWPSWSRPQEPGNQNRPQETNYWQTQPWEAPRPQPPPPSPTNSWETPRTQRNPWEGRPQGYPWIAATRPPPVRPWEESRPDRQTTSSWQSRPGGGVGSGSSAGGWGGSGSNQGTVGTTESRPVWGQPPVTLGTTARPSRPSKADLSLQQQYLGQSWAKCNLCKKYGEYVYKKVKPPTLALGETEERTEAFCGRVITPLIVRGEDARPREFPHMARIGYGQPPKIQWLCGGSLISERFVLSAAHCTKPLNQLASWVNLGDLDTSTERDDAQPVNLRITERFDHPNYRSGKSLYHDIALYRLERAAPLGIYIRPICLNTQTQLRDTTALASGWGHTFWRDPGGGSPMLQKVELKLVTNKHCNDSYRSNIPKDLPKGIYAQYMLCAGGHDGKDTCQGDSGGPLQIARREPYCTYSIIGVTSFGKGCGSNTPGVYTNVANYVPWIESIVWPT